MSHFCASSLVHFSDLCGIVMLHCTIPLCWLQDIVCIPTEIAFWGFWSKKKRRVGFDNCRHSWQWWILWIVLMWSPLDRHRCWSAVLIRFSPQAWTFRMEVGIEDPSQCLTCGLYLPIVPLWCIGDYYIHLFKGKLKLGSSPLGYYRCVFSMNCACKVRLSDLLMRQGR